VGPGGGGVVVEWAPLEQEKHPRKQVEKIEQAAMNRGRKAKCMRRRIAPTGDCAAHSRLGTLHRTMGRTEDAKTQIELYKKHKDMKEKLRALYKALQIQPKEISADEPEQK